MSSPDVDQEEVRRRCGCLRTSDKLKDMLASFPCPPPPSPVDDIVVPADTEGKPHLIREPATVDPLKDAKNIEDSTEMPYSMWRLAVELLRMLQVSTVATALVAYYLVYFYVQLLYVTFRSVVYFHNVDGPMKLTIGVITATSLLVLFNLFLKIQRLFCYH